MITPVVDELQEATGLDPQCVLVVGAACRDVLHAAMGHTFEVRATNDVDLGIAVRDWTVSDRIEKQYERIGDNGIRYRIAGLPVDVMPFGEVEDPDGISSPAARGEDLVVFGFQDVFERAVALELPGGAVVRLPQPAGYAALKMRAWIDRNMDKDAKDLALCTFWYQESGAVEDRLFGTEAGLQILAAVGWDVPVAAARLLGVDVAEQLETANHSDLMERWSALDMNILARDFVLPAGAGRIFRREAAHSYAGELGHAP
ncbi:hypothetical protein ACIQCM_13710 [Pseudarthrobacter sp. NPDC092439]|uniref:hypothetical protein n=1 Tax=unclassified Pseudarthrobacter TaxID=2647000 RepID=UPI00380906F0